VRTLVRVAAGPVVVMVDAPGHKRATRSVLVPPDTVANVGVNLEPEPVVPTDGASAPVATLPPPPEERPAPQPIAPVVSPSDGRRTRAWVLAAAGGVLLVEAVAAQITAEVLMSKYNDDTRCVYGTLTRDDRCGHYRHEADALRTAAVVGYGVGGVAAVVAAYLFATSSVKVTAGPAAGWGATVVTAW
jgi:hypothetical protein